MVLLVTGLYR